MVKNNYRLLLFFLLFCQFVTAQTAPVARDDNYSTQTNTPLNIPVAGVLINDTDADGDVLTVIEFSVNGNSYTVGQTATFPQGTIIINTDGSFSFNLTASCNRDIPTITYTISDGTFTDSANLRIRITNLFTPDARDDCDTVEINTPLIITASEGLLSNDTDEDNNFLCVISFSAGGITANAGDTIPLSGGSITIHADGSFSFIPTPNYIGDVPEINYCISDGTFTSCANLDLTVQPITDLLEISSLRSCNQGYTADGEYKIQYSMSLRNKSTAKDYHTANLIRNINLTNDLDAIYGVGCVTEVDVTTITTANSVLSCIGPPYPSEFGDNAINPGFLDATSSAIFNQNAIDGFTLYPGQSISIEFCVTVNPFCNGRPNPTPSGSGIDFNNIFDVTATTTLEDSTIENHGDTTNLLLTDFHTTEAVIAAGFYIEEPNPDENTDGTYDFINTVIITNEGATTTNNVNYNMGLGGFLDNGIVFNELTVTQVDGPTVSVNPSYDGGNTDNNSQLLLPGNSLGPGETIILEIFYLVAPFSSDSANSFSQMDLSQTQGGADGFDESTPENRRQYSFVTWSDGLGDHLDRYYPTSSPIQTVSSRLQCSCDTSSMVLLFPSSSTTNKTIIDPIDTIPAGILEHEEITFEITVTNTSPIVELDNLQLQDDLNSICPGNIISISSMPSIVSSTATTNPDENPNYDGLTDINLFDGTSGLLEPTQSITVQFTVLFYEDCIGANIATFSSTNPLGSSVNSSGSVSVNAFTDTDNDGISNFNDLDDDNDTIPDIEEYNGLDPLNRLNPLHDHDTDFIPNYRDTDYGVDANNDGIIDIFDFDSDGVPNHFDLDSDNDGIFDVVEVGNSSVDTNTNGRTNNPVGANGLDNTLETNDTFSASITYPILNTDGNNDDENPNFIDIDADGDGVVDNIEGQGTFTYNPPNGTITLETGIDIAYPNGIMPIDTDADTTPDYIDENSDDDYRSDSIEGWDFNNDGTPETTASSIDADGDGLDDAYDINNNLVNPTNGQVPTDFPNIDDPITLERDWREMIGVFVLIDNTSEDEGNNLEFTISLVTRNDHSIPVESTTPINIAFSISDPSPITVTDASFYDYTIQDPPTLTIPPLTSTGTFNVYAVDDTIDELDELFTLDGIITSSNTVNTEIAGIGTILDNDEPPLISMNDSRAIEGNDLEHTITLSHPSSRPIQIQVRTEDVTAINPYDYTFDANNPITLTIDGTIDPNNANTEVSFSIPAIDDSIDELDEETLNVTGTVTSGDVGGQDLAKIGTIVDNDDPPSITMNNSTEEEGVDLVHTITLSNPSSTPILVSIDVSDGTATSPDDYIFNPPNPRNFTIDATEDPADPQLEVQFSIPTRTDDINEPNEELNVIGTVTSGNVGTQDLTKTGTIIDINPDPMIVIDDVTVVEGSTLVFTITVLDENSEPVQNSFPINLDLETIDGTATSGQDFEMLLTNVTIPPLISSITQSVQTIDDRLNEDTETMELQVIIRSTGVTNSSPFVFGTGTIKDNDIPNLFSPNGDGKSDVFRIAGIEDFPNFKLIIIDRWGSEVYNYSNNGNINPIWWDGTHKGKPVIEGVYFYTLDFNDGSTPPQTNFIQLIR